MAAQLSARGGGGGGSGQGAAAAARPRAATASAGAARLAAAARRPEHSAALAPRQQPHGCACSTQARAGPLQRRPRVAAGVAAGPEAGVAPADAQQQPGAAADAEAAGWNAAIEQVLDGNAAAAAAAGEQQQEGQPPPPPAVRIQSISGEEQLAAVARLRADAYYADDNSRFAPSFRRQFAAQEVESLRQRTAAAAATGRTQLCDCLVALDEGSGSVVGCIDIRLPQTATSMRTVGVPEGDAAGCYILNVVVAEEARGRGVGKALMRAAMARAVHTWRAQRLYTHVEADNEVAGGLYKGCGFAEHSEESKYGNTLALGRLVLLTASADQAPLPEQTLWAGGGA